MSSSRKRVSTDSSPDTPPAKIKKENETDVADMEAVIQPFSECTITLAVDISGSTAGPTLLVEKKAILSICSELTGPARKAAKVVGWDHSVRPTMEVGSVQTLNSGGGTTPSNICFTQSSISALRESSLWFLMTDGEVASREVHKFANAVPNIQLHGTACVIIIFGQRPPMPKDVNISVGYCVFAVAPHCLLLFHDTTTDEVYTLRAKGCFESLLPMEEDPDTNVKAEIKEENNEDAKTKIKIKLEDQEMADAEEDTKWAEVTRIKYHDLATLRIPNPIPLSTDHIALSNGTTVSFNDVMNNRLPPHAYAQLFANERDMATIVTTAGSRGQSQQADMWLTSNTTTAGTDGHHGDRIRRSHRMLTASTSGGHSTLGGLGGSSRRSARADDESHTFGSTATLVAPESRETTGRSGTLRGVEEDGG